MTADGSDQSHLMSYGKLVSRNSLTSSSLNGSSQLTAVYLWSVVEKTPVSDENRARALWRILGSGMSRSRCHRTPYSSLEMSRIHGKFRGEFAKPDRNHAHLRPRACPRPPQVFGRSHHVINGCSVIVPCPVGSRQQKGGEVFEFLRKPNLGSVVTVEVLPTPKGGGTFGTSGEGVGGFGYR